MNPASSMQSAAFAISNAWRQALRWIRNRFEGAQWNPERSIIHAPLQGARFDASTSAREELVRKARYFERNSALVNRLADLFEAYTVGGGIVHQPASADTAWNQRARVWWEGWANLPDVSSRQTLATLYSLAARSWFIDGEVFIHLTRGESGRPRVQLIESHLVRTPDSERSNPSVVDGIRLDPNGRPVGYFVATESAAGRVSSATEISADAIVHLWEPSRPGQVRGLPFLYPVINTLHDLDDLRILEMKAAKQASRIAIKRTTATGEIDTEELLRSGGENASAGSDPEREDYYRRSIGGEEIVLKTGDELEQFRSDRPTVVTMEYWRDLREEVCVGVGIPYVLAYPDSMQGTVYRGALDMAHAWFLCRHEVIAAAARRVYAYVLGSSRFRERELQDPPADFTAVEIHPPKAVNVDVGRNSNAMLAELGAGTTTYAEVYGAKGKDWRAQLRQRAEEQKFVDSLGLKLQAGQVATEAQEDPEPDTDPEPETKPATK